MHELHNALLIHNPNAGGGGSARRAKLDEARRLLEAGGIRADLAETTGPGEATEIAKKATIDGRELVIACGGDGTINEVVNGLARAKNGDRVPLALLPAGTANVLAKELKLSWDIPTAAQQLAGGQVRDVALGLATPMEHPEKARYFLSVAGAGPDGRITYAVDLEMKARMGILAYWLQGVREVFKYKFQHFRVTSESGTRNVSLVIVGRTKHYGGPFKITTEADLFEDQFEFVGLTSRSGLKYLTYLPTLWFGDLRKSDGVHFWKSDRLVCEPIDAEPTYAQVDGEPLSRLPVEFRIVPRALRLLVPGPENPGPGS
jgi:YegS/Rv2252/BmrU family lipid kinase